MASSKALFLICLNLVFFTLVTSSYVPTPTPTTPCPPPPPSTPSHHGGHHHGHHGGPPSTGGKCPKDTLKIGACVDVLNGLVHAVVGPPRVDECCSLIDGLVGLDAGLCLCTRLQVDLLGLVHLNVPLDVQLLLNFCNKAGDLKNYQCP